FRTKIEQRRTARDAARRALVRPPRRRAACFTFRGTQVHRDKMQRNVRQQIIKEAGMARRGNTRLRSLTRRGFLTATGAVAGAAGLSSAVKAPFIARALAETKTLKILQWSHFVPQYDKWFDAFAAEWGKKNGVAVTVDHIPHLELPARAAAEVAAGA